MNKIKQLLKDTGHSKINHKSYDNIYNNGNISIIEYFLFKMNISIVTEDTAIYGTSVWDGDQEIVDEKILIYGNINVIQYLHENNYSYFDHKSLYYITNLEYLKKILNFIYLKYNISSNDIEYKNNIPKADIYALGNIDYIWDIDVYKKIDLMIDYKIFYIKQWYLIFLLSYDEIKNILEHYTYKNTSFFIFEDMDNVDINNIKEKGIESYLSYKKIDIQKIKNQENTKVGQLFISNGISLLEHIRYNIDDWNYENVNFLMNEYGYDFKNFLNNDYRLIMNLCEYGNITILREIFINENYNIQDFFFLDKNNYEKGFRRLFLYENENNVMNLVKRLNKLYKLNINIKSFFESSIGGFPIKDILLYFENDDFFDITNKDDLNKKIINKINNKIIDTFDFSGNSKSGIDNRKMLFGYNEEGEKYIEYYHYNNETYDYNKYYYKEKHIFELLSNIIQQEYYDRIDLSKDKFKLEEIKKYIGYFLENIDIYYDEENRDIIITKIINFFEINKYII